MIIILPIRLDGVGILLRHEKAFQTPNVSACDSIFICQLTVEATGGRHRVIGAMGSMDRVIALGGWGEGMFPVFVFWGTPKQMGLRNAYV